MEKRKQLLELFLLKDEIEYFHQALTNEEDLLNKFRLTKQNLIVLNVFLESLKKFNVYIKENEKLKDSARKIRKRGELITHMRNKISGHLDDDVLFRSAQWEPYIFSKAARGDRKSQVTLSYKSLLESSINSHIDMSDNETQKEFGTEIDLFYPPDITLFYNYLGGVNLDSIEWIKTAIELIEKKFNYFEDSEIFSQSVKAAATDFNLKNDFEIPK